MKPTTISRTLPKEVIDNFDTLKQEAIDWLAESCAPEWTDFNAHDPGVQILEELCYALTDFGYRASFPIETILANRTGEIDWRESVLFSPLEVFPMNPLTANDYRRLILDRLPEVINVWLESHQTNEPDGGYDVWLALAPELAVSDQQTIRAAVEQLLSEYRNLGEYFAPVKSAPVVKFWPTAPPHIAANLPEATALADLYRAVRAATLARPPTQTLAERKAAGECLSQILTGPLPEHGSVLDADLGNPPTWDDVRQRALLAMLPFVAPGAQVDLAFSPVKGKPPLVVYDFQLSEHDDSPPAAVEAAPPPVTAFVGPADRSMPKPAPVLARGELTKYRSIQDSFPPNYALRANEAPLDAPPLRRAQIKQLKGYLLFFEQILANGLAQLGRVGELLSGRPPTHTYFSQPIYDVPGIAPLLKGFNDGDLSFSPRELTERLEAWRKNSANAYQQGLEELADGDTDFYRRSQAFLDHLLARFGESYPQRDDTTYETIANKSALLRDYPALGRTRATGAGLEAKLARLLARNEQSWPEIKDGEGARYYYLIEHCLLRPAAPQPDWRFRLTHVFFNWTAQPLTKAFKEYVEEIVTENCGAHLLHGFLWFERETAGQETPELSKFAALYAAWANAGFPYIKTQCEPAAAVRLDRWLTKHLQQAAGS